MSNKLFKSIVFMSLITTGSVPSMDTLNEKIFIEDTNSDLEIPEEYQIMIRNNLSLSEDYLLSESDLSMLNDTFDLYISNPNSSLEFLKKTNIKTLNIYLTCYDISFLKDLNLSSKTKEVNIWGNHQLYLTSDDLPFINNSKIKKLSINGLNISPGSEDILNNLFYLKLSPEKYLDIDFKKLYAISYLDVSMIKPYDLAIYLNTEEYNYLLLNNVKIIFEDNEQRDKYFDACLKLDNIVEELEITDSDGEQDKLDKILIYTLDNLQYSKNIMTLDKSNEEEFKQACLKYYQDGNLYGSLYLNEAICGNYASLVEALFDRVSAADVCYYVNNDNHAWNIVNLDNKSYYTDATWLDTGYNNLETVSEAIENHDTSWLRWYLEDISKSTDHFPNYELPEYLNHLAITREDNYFKVVIKDRRYLLTSAGLLVFFSLFMAFSNIDKREKRPKIKK